MLLCESTLSKHNPSNQSSYPAHSHLAIHSIYSTVSLYLPFIQPSLGYTFFLPGGYLKGICSNGRQKDEVRKPSSHIPCPEQNLIFIRYYLPRLLCPSKFFICSAAPNSNVIYGNFSREGRAAFVHPLLLLAGVPSAKVSSSTTSTSIISKAQEIPNHKTRLGKGRRLRMVLRLLVLERSALGIDKGFFRYEIFRCYIIESWA